MVLFLPRCKTSKGCLVSKMDSVVWCLLMLVAACVVGCQATVPTYILSQKNPDIWDHAAAKCGGIESVWLAMPRTSKQGSSIIKLLTQRIREITTSQKRAWLGVHRKVAHGSFYFVDDDTVPLSKKPVLGIEWTAGNPDDNGDERGVEAIGDDWGLNDRPCSTKSHYVCQIPDDAPPSMSVTADLVDAGHNVTLTCTRGNIGQGQAVIYTYRKNGSADIGSADIFEQTSSANSDTHTLTSVNVSDTGRYWCTVGATLKRNTVDYFTLSTSNSISLRVTPKTPTFSLDPPVPVTGVYDGTQVTFLCASDSATGGKIVPTYHFLQDGIIIESRTVLNYTKNMTTSDIGNYACKVTMNGVDSAVSNIITVEAFTTTAEPNTTAESNTTATPATNKNPGLSPEKKVLVGIQLVGFAAGLFGLLGMCVPVVYVCLRRACCKRDKEEKEEDEDEDDQHSDEDGEHKRKVHWESEEDEEKTESTVSSIVSSIVSHAENAVKAVWSGMSGTMSALMVPGVMPGSMKRGSGETNIDDGGSPDTTPTSASESPSGSVISRLFGSDLFVPRLSGSAIVTPSEVSPKQEGSL